MMPRRAVAAAVEVKLAASPASTEATVTLPGTSMVARMITLPAVICKWTARQSITTLVVVAAAVIAF